MFSASPRKTPNERPRLVKFRTWFKVSSIGPRHHDEPDGEDPSNFGHYLAALRAADTIADSNFMRSRHHLS